MTFNHDKDECTVIRIVNLRKTQLYTQSIYDIYIYMYMYMRHVSINRDALRRTRNICETDQKNKIKF